MDCRILSNSSEIILSRNQNVALNNTLSGYPLLNDVNSTEWNSSATNSCVLLRPLARGMTFNEDNLVSIIAYFTLFIIAASGNLTVFLTLFRNRRHIKSRINLFIMHLAVADLVVTFVMMPMEMAWNVSVSWRAGDVACRILMFLRAFGFYTSSYVLVTITLDRFFAIMKPMSLNSANKRGRIMLALAWICGALSSLPQSIIFHVERHPVHTWFEQCLTFNFFPSDAHELAYNIFNITAIYFLPLVIIIISYTIILYEISKKAQENKVLVFVICWTPYFVISAWWWFHEETAAKIDPKLQKGLFVFAVSNSCMNPIVYGMFTINFRREWGRCCRQRHTCSPRKYYYSQQMSANLRNGSLNGLVVTQPTPQYSKMSITETPVNKSQAESHFPPQTHILMKQA